MLCKECGTKETTEENDFCEFCINSAVERYQSVDPMEDSDFLLKVVAAFIDRVYRFIHSDDCDSSSLPFLCVDLDKALFLANHVFSRDPEATDFNQIWANILHLRGDIIHASALPEGAKRFESLRGGYMNIGSFIGRLSADATVRGRLQKASEDYRSSLTYCDNSLVRHKLAFLLAELNRTQEAIVELKTVCRKEGISKLGIESAMKLALLT